LTRLKIALDVTPCESDVCIGDSGDWALCVAAFCRAMFRDVTTGNKLLQSVV
jgi:hypothetical protein